MMSTDTLPAKKRAALSFTGGKDCHLALARCSREEYDVVCLVIFHPPSKKFRAHPLEWQEQQARALQLPLALYCVEAIRLASDTTANDNHKKEPCYKQGYARAIRQLHADYAVDTIITGDIDYVGSMTTNFMTEVCETYVPHVSVTLPLWQTKDRTQLLLEMIEERGFVIAFSCVKEPLDASWIGRRLDRDAIRDLQRLNIDMTGENGEYHTMVLFVPALYIHSLKLVRLAREQSNNGDTEQLESIQPMAQELKDQLGQKERWWVCHPDIQLEKDSSN